MALIDRDYLCFLCKISGTRFEMSRIISWLVWQLGKVLWPFFSYRPVWKAPHFVTFDIFQDEEKAKLTHSRLLELCRGVATEHVLHKYNIVDPSIASLTSKPAKLVCQLYEKYGAREPGTAHLPPGTSTNSAKRPTKKLPLLIYGCFENLRLPPFKHVSVLFPVIPKCVWRVKNYSPLRLNKWWSLSYTLYLRFLEIGSSSLGPSILIPAAAQGIVPKSVQLQL